MVPKLYFLYKPFPILKPRNFVLFQLKQSYISQTFINSIKQDKILTNLDLYQYITKPCTIANKIAYCNIAQLEKVQNTCIPAIINNLPANCQTLSNKKYHQMQKNYRQEKYARIRRKTNNLQFNM